MIPLSVLDLSPVATGMTGAQALRNSLDLARLCDSLGYVRYWVAEHHNMPAIASSAPDIMIGQIAAVTNRMRIGSGGVMLPNHAPLMVAERFKILEALYPGRIDLGLGRAPGTDPATSYALRRRQGVNEEDDFLERFQELMLLETRGFPAGHPFHKVRAMPADVPLPPIYLLGSSDYSAQLAGQIGAAFAFAHHFATFPADEAMRLYRDSFKPSVSHDKPLAILGTQVMVADTDEEAERLALTFDLNTVRRAKGEYLPLASPEEAAAFDYTPVDRARIAQGRHRIAVGSAKTVRDKLMPLIEATKADELMATSTIFDHAARRRSYELLAQAFKD
jgi:luciferase family oxidoreductase group 1